ncbi:MAG: tetratricopeptide repeat protein [Candidatus Electrothrix sp. YB6]
MLPDDLIVGFIIYALTFRLAIIAAGIVSIVFGYKLFALGVMGGEKTRINAQAGQIKLTLANAGPGLGFALFGVLIIAVMLFQGNPEIVLKDVQLVIKDLQQGGTPSEVHIGSAAFKGGNDNKISQAVQRFNQALNEGKQLQHAGDIEAAITVYNKVLSDSEAPFILNELAWLYREQQQLDEALVLAHAATTVDQKDSNSFDTLALILLDRKEFEAAEHAAQTALKLDPANQDYKETLNKVQAAKNSTTL